MGKPHVGTLATEAHIMAAEVNRFEVLGHQMMSTRTPEPTTKGALGTVRGGGGGGGICGILWRVACTSCEKNMYVCVCVCVCEEV